MKWLGVLVVVLVVGGLARAGGPRVDSLLANLTGNGTRLENSCTMFAVRSEDWSSHTTSSCGSRVWRAILSNCAERNCSPL